MNPGTDPAREHDLHLSPAEAEIPDTLFFERRREPRRRASGQVTAVCQDVENPEGPRRMCTLELRDMSDGGIGVTSKDPISVGSKLTLFFAPHGSEAGFDLTGTVVRCRSTEDEHIIGIALAQAAKLAG